MSSVGSLGSTTLNVAGTALTMSPSHSVAAGQLVVVWFAWDGGRSPGETADGLNARWSCYDDAGNLWSTVSARSGEFNRSPGVGIFVSRLRSGLTTGSTITINCQISLRVAKMMGAWEFDCSQSMRWAVQAVPNGDQREATAAVTDLSFGTAGGGDAQDNLQYLMLYGLAVRLTGGAPTITTDSDYTTAFSLSTGDVSLSALYRIAKLDGDTVSASLSAAKDWTTVYSVLCEAPYLPEEPQTPLYDDFNRADENPLDGGLWETTGDIPTTNFPGELVSNRVKSGGSWSLAVHTRRCAEVWASFPVAGSLGWGLVLHGAGNGAASTRSGYELAGLPIQGKADHDRFELGNAGFSAGMTSSRILLWRDPADDDRMLLRRHQKVVTAYLYLDGDWEWVGGFYLTGGGPSAPVSGKVGFEIFDTTGRMDDFGQGEFPCPDWMPEFIRRPWRYQGRVIDSQLSGPVPL